MYIYIKFLLFNNILVLTYYFNILHLFRASFIQILNFACTLSANNLFTLCTTGVVTSVSFTIATL